MLHPFNVCTLILAAPKRRKTAVRQFRTLVTATAVCAVMSLFTQSAYAQGGDELRSAVQNPLANPISLPFQNNTDFGIGPHDRTRNTLNIQPVVPVGLGPMLLINRVILPVVKAARMEPVEALHGKN